MYMRTSRQSLRSTQSSDSSAAYCGLRHAGQSPELIPAGAAVILTGRAGEGGERQRIGLARAFVKKPEILILDEATSNLDFKSEANVYDTLFGGKLKCTTIIVAHRLSTVRRCNRIFMVADGKIAETGTHDELIAKHGLYWKMWNSQVGNAEDAVACGKSGRRDPPDADRSDESDDRSVISYG